MRLITKATGIIIALMLAIFLVVGNVQATPIGIIDLVAEVNPNVNGSFTGPGDVDGTAEYWIGIDPNSAYGANAIQVVYEGDIFESVSNLTLTSTTPAGWVTTLGPNGINFSADAMGTPGVLNPGETLSFTMDYVLTDTNAFFYGQDPNNNPALWTWSIDGPEPWNQSVTAGLYNGGFFPVATGASSTLPNPEPGTMILMGIGLTGIAGMGIRRKYRKGEKKE